MKWVSRIPYRMTAVAFLTLVSASLVGCGDDSGVGSGSSRSALHFPDSRNQHQHFGPKGG
jgi:hypothetical protein